MGLLLREIVELLPSPVERGSWQVQAPDGEAAEPVEPDPKGPFSAVVFKTMIDREDERQSAAARDEMVEAALQVACATKVALARLLWQGCSNKVALARLR